jgi:hydrogenase nickel incorporation protein HypA/HybF
MSGLSPSLLWRLDKWALQRGVEVRWVVVSVSSASQLDVRMLREAFDMLKQVSRLARVLFD